MRRTFIAAIACTILSTACAQSPLTSGKGSSSCNPLCPFNFCADPTAVVHDGRVYVYGTNDNQEFEVSGYSASNSYGKINSLVCMSSEDLVNWTWHRPIDVKKVAPWTSCSWAPSVCSRTDSDGAAHFYLYFANGASGIGVLTADSPTGPWSDPLGHVFIGGNTPGMGQVVWLFDPGVVVSPEGEAWLAWGGGDQPNNVGNKLLDGNTRIAKLADDMCSFASDIMVLPAPFHFEASELNFIGDKLVYTYCSNWDGDRSLWSEFEYYDHSKPKPSAPSAAQMCYMTTSTPLDPESWQYVGSYLDHPGGNNHTHLQKVGDKYYLFYHSEMLARAINGDGKGYRSICANPIDVDEDNCIISRTTAGEKGITADRNHPIELDSKQQAEMLWNAAGITMRYSGRGYSTVAVSPKQAGSWTAVKNTHSSEEIRSVRARLRGKGTLELRLDRVNGSSVATVEFNSTSLADYDVALTAPFKGTHTLYFVFTELDESLTAEFDEWQLFADDITGLPAASLTPQIVKEEFFSTSGISCPPAPGALCIKRTTYSDGSVITSKEIR